MEVMIRLQQVYSLALIRWKVHAFGPLVLLCPGAIHGDEAVRRKNGVPELICLGGIRTAVFRVPPEGPPNGV